MYSKTKAPSVHIKKSLKLECIQQIKIEGRNEERFINTSLSFML